MDSMNDYVKQLEEANHTLQQKVEELQVKNEVLSLYKVRIKNYSKIEWVVCVGSLIIGNIKFDNNSELYSVKLIRDNKAGFKDLQECQEYVMGLIKRGREKVNVWKLTI